MIKKSIYTFLYCASFAIVYTFTACSEDSLSPMDKLGETIYDPTDSEAGTTNAAINAFYEKYGSKILYDFNASDLNFGWSSSQKYWYAPVKEEYKNQVDDIVKFLTEEAFQDYPDEFIKKFLPYRIFLVEQICNTTEYNEGKLQDVFGLTTHGIAIANVGEKMSTWQKEDWNTLKSKIVGYVMSSIYKSFENNSNLVKFGEIKVLEPYFDIATDPKGEFTDFEYTLYSNGYAGGDLFYEVMVMPPYFYIETDLGQFITLILGTPKSKMDNILARFSLLKDRLLLVANFIKEGLEMDPIAMQNSACPNDPYPADYFKK